MSKKILLIGSQGYLGSRVTDYLQEHGYECVGADVGFFQYGVLYYPKSVSMLNKEARTLIEKDLEAKKIKILEKLEIGQVLEGLVKNMTNFGSLSLKN